MEGIIINEVNKKEPFRLIFNYLLRLTEIEPPYLYIGSDVFDKTMFLNWKNGTSVPRKKDVGKIANIFCENMQNGESEVLKEYIIANQVSLRFNWDDIGKMQNEEDTYELVCFVLERTISLAISSMWKRILFGLIGIAFVGGVIVAVAILGTHPGGGGGGGGETLPSPPPTYVKPELKLLNTKGEVESQFKKLEEYTDANVKVTTDKSSEKITVNEIKDYDICVLDKDTIDENKNNAYFADISQIDKSYGKEYYNKDDIIKDEKKEKYIALPFIIEGFGLGVNVKFKDEFELKTIKGSFNTDIRDDNYGIDPQQFKKYLTATKAKVCMLKGTGSINVDENNYWLYGQHLMSIFNGTSKSKTQFQSGMDSFGSMYKNSQKVYKEDEGLKEFAKGNSPFCFIGTWNDVKFGELLRENEMKNYRLMPFPYQSLNSKNQMIIAGPTKYIVIKNQNDKNKTDAMIKFLEWIIDKDKLGDMGLVCAFKEANMSNYRNYPLTMSMLEHYNTSDRRRMFNPLKKDYEDKTKVIFKQILEGSKSASDPQTIEELWKYLN